MKTSHLRSLIVGALLALIVNPALGGIGALGRAAAGISTGTPSGFLPAGHFIAAKQPMIQVFPRPDSETASYAREHWAFWDGTHDIPYDIALGVSFGAYPYVFTLESGPPGMTIEQTTYTTFQNVQYGRILWHPQGNISSNWSGTVSVLVTDQQHNTITISYTLSTDDTTTHFVFVSPTGSGSTCTYSAPCLMSTAFGATFATTAFPSAIAYAFGGTYSGAASLPYYTDNDIFGNSTPLFEPNNTKKPDALIGIPGQTVTLDATGGPTSGNNTLIGTGAESADWYMENIQANGYNATAIDHLIMMLSGGSGTYRQTYDQIVWNNSGYGSGTNNNMSMFASSGNSSPREYLFITDSAENNRQSGSVGNNFGFCDLYSETNYLVDRNTENSPSANLDEVFLNKSDAQNGDMRENFADVAGANGAFDYLQNQYIESGFDESDYNIGINVGGMMIPYTGGYTWGPIWSFRNSIIASRGLSSNAPAYNLEGPQQNAPTPTTGSLAAGTYYSKITSLGVTGESSGTNGILGGGNEISITLGSTGGIVYSWTDIANAPGGSCIYIGTASGGENTQFCVAAGVTSFTYTGQAGTTATPPSSSTALTAYRFNYDSNAVQSSTSPQPISGAAMASDGKNNGSDIVVSTGLLDSTTGDLTGIYANPPSTGGLLGIVGAQISGTP